MKSTARNLLNTFIAGALAALPLFATVLIVVWAVRFLYAYVGPDSTIGKGLMAVGLGLTESEIIGYLIGVAIVIAALFVLGIFVRTGLIRFSAMVLNMVMQHIPIVRNIYDLAKSLVDLLSQRDTEKLKSMSPVWLHFGGVGGAAVLGLLSTPEPVRMGDKSYLAVLVPTAPVPVGGGLLYVPEEWVTRADVGVDGLTSIYVSMGITSHQYIGVKKDTAPEGTAK